MHYLAIIHKLYNLAEDANHGYPEAVIAALEARLQIQLPASLRQYYISLGNNKAVNDSFNRLTSLGEIGFSEDEHLIFYEENQAVVLWGIAKTELQQDNPAVYGTYDSAGKNGLPTPIPQNISCYQWHGGMVRWADLSTPLSRIRKKT